MAPLPSPVPAVGRDPSAVPAVVLGPVVAGVLIAVLRHKGTGSAGALGEWGIGIVFALDAVSFLVSAVTLSLIKLPSKSAGDRGPADYFPFVREFGGDRPWSRERGPGCDRPAVL